MGSTPTGLAGTCTLFGALFGYLIGNDILISLKYIATALLIYTAAYVFRDAPISKKPWFMPAITAGMMACTGFVYFADAGWTWSAAVLFLTEIAATCFSAYVFRIALSPWPDPVYTKKPEFFHRVCIFFLFGAFLLSFSGLTLFRIISIGRFCAVLLVLLITFKGGAGEGCSSAAAFGIFLDMQNGALPFYTMSFCISALCSSLFSRYGRLPFLVIYILSNAVSVLWLMQSSTISLFYEVFIASVIMLLLPEKVLTKIGGLFPDNIRGYGILKAREYTKARTEQTAAAFRALYETVRTAAGDDRNDEDVATVFDRAAEKVCRNCSKSSRCWQKDYETTLSVLNDLTPQMLESGSVTIEDFPVHFSEICQDLDDLKEAINYELQGMLYRRQYRSRLQEKQGTAYRQYADMAAVLKSLAAELGTGITFEPALEKKLQKYLRSLNIDASAAVFRDGENRLHIEIQSGCLYLLAREKNVLDKLSSIVGTRLCSAAVSSVTDKMVLLEAEPYAVTVGVASVKKEGQPSSGDKGAYFKTDEGIFYIILSDGMGSGPEAAACSSHTIHLLKLFLTAGVSPEISLHILNDLMLLKNENDTCCATIDLMSINLFTGEAKIFKFGAAPTYIKKHSKVHTVKCGNFAPGLNIHAEDGPERTTLKMSSDTFAVIVSDGTLGNSDDAWLRKLISTYEGTSPKTLSRSILETAAAKYGQDDDMTVLTVCMSHRP